MKKLLVICLSLAPNCFADWPWSVSHGYVVEPDGKNGLQVRAWIKQVSTLGIMGGGAHSTNISIEIYTPNGVKLLAVKPTTANQDNTTTLKIPLNGALGRYSGYIKQNLKCPVGMNTASSTIPVAFDLGTSHTAYVIIDWKLVDSVNGIYTVHYGREYPCPTKCEQPAERWINMAMLQNVNGNTGFPAWVSYHKYYFVFLGTTVCIPGSWRDYPAQIVCGDKGIGDCGCEQ